MELKIIDPSTLANIDVWTTTSLSLDWSIEFEKEIIVGNASLKLIKNTPSKIILLDTKGLKIEAVKVQSKDVKFKIHEARGPLGEALEISLNEDENSVEVLIDYATTSKCTALQFLTPEQTLGKSPYVFSQCEPIHARSLFPCQDSPSIKAPVQYKIKSPYAVVVSGLAKEHKDDIYIFEQPIPIPSYLVAIASGDIHKAKIGPRSYVYAEPAALEASKWELERDTESFIANAEKITNLEYIWTLYDVLILPPSFPFGGMENPNMTFATPTIIAGDRSNVDVIAHELSHSFSGNLVTNASWEHFWLNEGWTTYLERRLVRAIHGEQYRQFSMIIGWKALKESVNAFGEDHAFTKLIVDLKGDLDPDDAFSSIPYEKGFHLLYHLEGLLGIEKFDGFIQAYFKKFQNKSITSWDFQGSLFDYYKDDKQSAEILSSVKWGDWFFKTGLPPKPKFDDTLAKVCYSLADDWDSKGRKGDTTHFSQKDIKNWTSSQVVMFLERIGDFKDALPAETSQEIDSIYKFSESKNAEILARYYIIALQSRNKNAYLKAAKWLGEVGRMKFVRPLYKLLNECDSKLAVETFKKNRDFYHPICRNMVEKDLSL